MPAPAQKIPFPASGLNTVAGYDSQPPGTTPDCLNVRGFDAIANRLRGGQRPGLSKWLDEQVNGNNGIQCLHPTVLGTPYTAGSLGEVTAIDDDLTTLPAVYPGPASSNYIYLYKRNSDNRMRWANDYGTSNDSGTVALGFGNGGNTNNVFHIAALRWRMAEDKIEAFFDSTSSNSSDSRGTRGNCFGRAVYLKMGVTLSTGICAALIRTANDTVRLRIIDLGTSAETTVMESGDLTLSDSSTFNASLYISLEVTGTTVTATTHWNDEYNAGAGDAGWNPASPTVVTADIRTSGNGGDFTNSHENNFRGGVGVFGNMNFSTEPYKWVNRVVTTVFTPTTPSITRSMRRADASPANNFFVPSGLTSAYVDSSPGGAPETITGPDSSSSRTGDFSDAPVIDDASDQIDAGGFSDGTNDVGFVTQTVNPTTREAVRSETLITGDTTAVDFVTRVSDNFQNFIRLELEWDTSADNDVVLQMDVIFNDLDVSYYTNGSLLDRDSISLTHDIVAHYNDEIVFRDDGTVLTVEINGMEVVSVTPDSTNATAVGDTNRTGFAVQGSTSALESVGATWLQTVNDNDLPLASTSESSLLVASGGTVARIVEGEVQSVQNGDGAVTDQLFQVVMQSAYGSTYIVDGVRSLVYSQTTNSITQWVATAGTLPARSRLLALYRGRVVHSGVVGDEHNWFMSALGDPLNYDYSPATPSAIQAVAGNNSEAGLVGDSITALIPFSDDALLFGATNSIWQMTGDPAAGGAIDLVTDETGMAFGKAWAKDPNNTLYFMGTDGVYRYRLGDIPENMTVTKVDRVFKNIDLDFNRIYLEWDFLRNGLMVMIVPANPTQANTAYFWDARTDSWWPDEYAATVGPVFMFPYNGPRLEDQELLFGGRDGFIRKVDDAAGDDDGSAITSRVRYAPLMSGDPGRELIMHEVYPVLAAGSGDLTMQIHAAQTAEAVVTSSSPRYTRTLSAGRNPSARQRVRGANLLIELTQTGSTRWALESLSAVVRTAGKARRQ